MALAAVDQSMAEALTQVGASGQAQCVLVIVGQLLVLLVLVQLTLVHLVLGIQRSNTQECTPQHVAHAQSSACPFE